jgi:hypothetical protein
MTLELAMISNRLDLIPKVQATKEKNKLDLIKVKSLWE